MDVVEFVPTVEQYAFTFGGVAPIRRVQPGTALRIWSDDAFGGRLRAVTDLSSEKVDLRFVNPQSGPFHVEGAEPGDTLAIHLVSLEPARDWGASAHIPFFGGMTSTDRVVTLQDALPDTTYIYELDRARQTVTFAARFGDLRVGLEGFTGSGRRMEPKGEAGGVRVYDSYAHHPAEIAADLSAARAVAGEGRLIVVFQPHLVSRTRLSNGTYRYFTYLGWTFVSMSYLQ